jgi:hypothetical protein
MQRTTRLICAVVLTGTLVGCGSETPPPAESRQESEDVSAWRVGFDGAGPARVGRTIDDLGAALEDSVARENWHPPVCDYAHLPSLPSFTFMIRRDTIIRINVDTTGVETQAGIGVGSTEQEVLDAYPYARVEPHPYNGPQWHYLVVDDPEDSALGMIFETDGRTVHRYRVGRRRAVARIEGCS